MTFSHGIKVKFPLQEGGLAGAHSCPLITRPLIQASRLKEPKGTCLVNTTPGPGLEPDQKKQQ